MDLLFLSDLEIACQSQYALLLLSSGAMVDAKDRDGWTSLMFAAEQGHAEIAELLLQHRADVAQVKTWGRSESGRLIGCTASRCSLQHIEATSHNVCCQLIEIFVLPHAPQRSEPLEAGMEH